MLRVFFVFSSFSFLILPFCRRIQLGLCSVLASSAACGGSQAPGSSSASQRGFGTWSTRRRDTQPSKGRREQGEDSSPCHSKQAPQSKLGGRSVLGSVAAQREQVHTDQWRARWFGLQVALALQQLLDANYMAANSYRRGLMVGQKLPPIRSFKDTSCRLRSDRCWRSLAACSENETNGWKGCFVGAPMHLVEDR